mmetsp:Transcript_29396/g.62366  ORF Transcript_29396/g.62366 Transcript_29396/m.62366 type:complete len:440 (+) Transcript_29396:1843-3162(+)
MEAHLLRQRVQPGGDVDVEGQSLELLPVLGQGLDHLLQVAGVDVVLLAALARRLMLGQPVGTLEVVHLVIQKQGRLGDVLVPQLHPDGVVLPEDHLPLLTVPHVRVDAVLEDVVLDLVAQEVEAHALVGPLVDERGNRVHPPVDDDELARLGLGEGVDGAPHLSQLPVERHGDPLRDERPLARAHRVPLLRGLAHLEPDGGEFFQRGEDGREPPDHDRELLLVRALASVLAEHVPQRVRLARGEPARIHRQKLQIQLLEGGQARQQRRVLLDALELLLGKLRGEEDARLLVQGLLRREVVQQARDGPGRRGDEVDDRHVRQRLPLLLNVLHDGDPLLHQVGDRADGGQDLGRHLVNHQDRPLVVRQVLHAALHHLHQNPLPRNLYQTHGAPLSLPHSLTLFRESAECRRVSPTPFRKSSRRTYWTCPPSLSHTPRAAAL